MLKTLKPKLRKVLKFVVAAALVSYVLVLTPNMHSKYLRYKVGSQVVKLTDKAGTSGGTGFAVKTASGKVLTLTNAHVCRIPGGIFAALTNGRQIPLQIVEIYDKHDLCLLQGISGLTGVSLADSVDVGDQIEIIGHPKLMPLNVSKGEIIGYQQVVVMTGQGPCEETQTNPPYSTIMTPFGEACILTVKAGLSNAIALPGNSGSPVVNIFGNLTGVLFCGDPGDNWGIFVPLKFIKDLVKAY